MSVDTALPKYLTSNTNRPLEFLSHYADTGNLDLDQPYQRGSVWGLVRKQNLMKSFLMGVPVPALVINDRFSARFSHPGYDEERNWSYSIVDGKQRTLAILGFLRGEFAIPGEWVGRSGPAHFTDFPLRDQRGFRGFTIPVCEGQFSTLAQERELFDLINFGGVAQGDSDNDSGGEA